MEVKRDFFIPHESSERLPLKIKAAATSTSISELIDNAIRHELALDEEDLRTFDDRASEPTVSFEKVLKDLKANGKV